ncbi:class I adenylate-forming enzyme family protein [Castellaniella sp.]|uniref:class I adenylate-forming enzyme family protein n=2 Tax=Castellaniella sp. TaxID=1955812 RepID=UPI00355FD0DE
MLATRREQHFGHRVILCFQDRPANLNDMRHAAASRDPAREALVHDALRLDWQQFNDRVMRAAAGLQALGVGQGDRVALLLSNRPEFVLACYAVWALGAAVVPLNIREQMPGIRYILQDCEARLLIHDANLQALVPPAPDTPALRHQVHTDTLARGGGIAWAELLQHAPLASCARVAEEDMAVILYTSGTTGFPKGAVLTHFNIVHSVLNYTQVLQLDEHVRGMAVVPLSHVTGLVALMAVVLGLGGTLLIASRFKASEFLVQAAQERMSYTLMVPAMYRLCLLQEDYRRHDLSAWAVGGFGGAPMPPEVLDQLHQWLPDLRLSNCYGATETTSPVTVMPAHLTHDHLDSVGPPLPVAEVLIMSPEGRELPRGEVGELWLKGPMVAKGYWHNAQATEDNFVGGYWRSGDVGYMDAQGFVYVKDRYKDLINRGGYKIYSVEVENCLSEHPDVVEAAVVGTPCPVLGERVHAFVVPRAGSNLTGDALQAFCAQRLADYKVPETFTLGTEPLPRNANGKLLKRLLRERVQPTDPS